VEWDPGTIVKLIPLQTTESAFFRTIFFLRLLVREMRVAESKSVLQLRRMAVAVNQTQTLPVHSLRKIPIAQYVLHKTLLMLQLVILLNANNATIALKLHARVCLALLIVGMRPTPPLPFKPVWEIQT
jgi:hypothetical protein